MRNEKMSNKEYFEKSKPVNSIDRKKLELFLKVKEGKR